MTHMVGLFWLKLAETVTRSSRNTILPSLHSRFLKNREKNVAVPLPYKGRYVYHFTHIDNLPNLLQTGFLANNHPDFPGNDHRSIAEPGIQQRRAQMVVPCGPGGRVHDYVPLYFGSRSLMLLSVINKKNTDQMDILYFEFPIELVERDNIVFTDASANTLVPPNFYSDPKDLAGLNWEAINSLRWSESNDTLRHQRMAEVLVRDQLPLAAAVQCVVWNADAQQSVEAMVAEAGAVFPPIAFESQHRRHWYTPINGDNSSLVKGPREIALLYEQACEEIEAERGKLGDSAPFPRLKDLLEELRENFGCLTHTAELVGLKSANGVHKETVDVHTQQVVERLLSLEEYAELGAKQKRLVELAAYLHDIGKGPKSRWDSNGGLQKVDPNHPVGAMPMMVDILTNYVGTVSARSAGRLAKLVCYHDLIGDVLGKGRNEQQITDAVDDKDELDMLFALGKADASVLVEHWWDQNAANELYGRCLEAIVGSED